MTNFINLTRASDNQLIYVKAIEIIAITKTNPNTTGSTVTLPNLTLMVTESPERIIELLAARVTYPIDQNLLNSNET